MAFDLHPCGLMLKNKKKQMVKSIPKSKHKEYKSEKGKEIESWSKRLCNKASLHKTIPKVGAHTSVAFL